MATMANYKKNRRPSFDAQLLWFETCKNACLTARIKMPYIIIRYSNVKVHIVIVVYKKIHRVRRLFGPSKLRFCKSFLLSFEIHYLTKINLFSDLIVFGVK